ncbi:tyrosine-type recombinase/integrase [Arthrobacter flavus]|uniref:Tyrosine-type recombinase/integrase n=1 Tax=Arthrobacter flavus TaxID=95172 RepID=A0ABW4Q2B1_9MICC
MATIESYQTKAGKRYRVRYRTPERTQTDKRGFKTKRDAENFASSVEVSKLRGEWVDPTKSRVTVTEWAEQWFAAQVHLKPTTLSGYRLGLDKHVLPRWGSTRITAITHGAIQTWVNELSMKLAPSTVRQTHLVLSGVLKFAVLDGRLNKNPSDDIRLPRIVQKDHGYLDHGQVANLASAVGDYGDVVLFLAYTGLRWGEMAGLKVGRLDMLRRRVAVVEAVSEPRGTIVWGTPKNHEGRSVPFPEFLSEILAKRCENKKREDLVFTSSEASVLRGGNFRRRHFDAAVRSLMESDPDFPKISPHDLRHTAASLAVSAGANVKAVQRMLGHKSAAMTLDVYADLFDDDLDAVAVMLNHGAASANVGKMWAESQNGLNSEAPRLREIPAI